MDPKISEKPSHPDSALVGSFIMADPSSDVKGALPAVDRPNRPQMYFQIRTNRQRFNGESNPEPPQNRATSSSLPSPEGLNAVANRITKASKQAEQNRRLAEIEMQELDDSSMTSDSQVSSDEDESQDNDMSVTKTDDTSQQHSTQPGQPDSQAHLKITGYDMYGTPLFASAEDKEAAFAHVNPPPSLFV
jgi:hypothetical protein